MIPDASDLGSMGFVSGLYIVLLVSDVSMPFPNEVDWRRPLVYITIITGSIRRRRPNGPSFVTILPTVAKTWQSYSDNPKRIFKIELLPKTHLITTAHRFGLVTPCGNINRDPHTVGFGLCNFALLYTDGSGAGARKIPITFPNYKK